jgi:hypothetical protein
MATETVSIVIKAFDQTQRALRGIQAAFGKLSKVFFNFKTALISAVGGAGLGLLITKSLQATDALAKTSARIGTTTDQLSKLQFAGSLAGVETNTLNMAMQRFVRRTAEATQGTGEAVRAFQQLKIDAKEIQELPLAERMKVLAEAFGELKTEEEKLAVECGYWHLYRYNPELQEKGENPFIFDSKEPEWSKFQDFLGREVRYTSLKKSFPGEAAQLFTAAEENAKWRYDSYQRMANMDFSK